MMAVPVQNRLSVRVRLICIGVFVLGALLPPYVPTAAFSVEETDATVTTDQYLLVEEGFLMKSSSLTEQGARLAFSESIVHTVQEGESLEKLAQMYGIFVDTIRWANGLEMKSTLRPGQEVKILPVDGVLHTVKRGQTLSRIAELYDVPSEKISRQNKIEGGYIVADQTLIIPGGKPIIAKTVIAAVPEKPLTFGSKIPADTAIKGVPEPQKTAVTKAPEVAAQVTLGVMQLPCNNCSFTQYYHASHFGVDIQTKGGGPVFAAEAGTVIRADTGWNGGYGNVIEIDHGNGVVTLYAHNKELFVSDGDSIARGQVIAWMGNTGRVYGQTGIHTHFEVHVNGVKKNPMLYLQ